MKQCLGFFSKRPWQLEKRSFLRAASTENVIFHVRNEKTKPGCLEYMSVMKFLTHLSGDYFINQCNDPVFKQPGFNGKYPSFFFHGSCDGCFVTRVWGKPHGLPTNRAETGAAVNCPTFSCFLSRTWQGCEINKNRVSFSNPSW